MRKIAETDMPRAAKQALAQLGRCIAQLDTQLEEINQHLATQHKAPPVSQRVAEIPGVGPLTALTVVMKVDPGQFASARHFAAWLGLTPREHSTGSRQSLGGISRAGNERLRQLLVVGALSASLTSLVSRVGACDGRRGHGAGEPVHLLSLVLVTETRPRRTIRLRAERYPGRRRAGQPDYKCG